MLKTNVLKPDLFSPSSDFISYFEDKISKIRENTENGKLISYSELKKLEKEERNYAIECIRASKDGSETRETFCFIKKKVSISEIKKYELLVQETSTRLNSGGGIADGIFLMLKNAWPSYVMNRSYVYGYPDGKTRQNWIYIQNCIGYKDGSGQISQYVKYDE